MTRLTSILVATDFSSNATDAVRKAALLANQHSARLTLLHVVNPSGCKPLRQWFTPSIDVDLKTAQARATLRRFAAEITGKHGVRTRIRVVIGDAFHEILRASDGAGLLVLGHRGRNPIRDLMVGGTTERLLRSCRRAMLVVKQPLDGPYRNILVPVDFGAHAPACLRAALGMGQAARLHIFHAVDSTEELHMRIADVPASVIRAHNDAVDRDSHLRMQLLAAKAGVEIGRVNTVVRRGPAWACALDQADELRADLIVVGKHGTSAMAEFLLGSLPRRLLGSSKCDLLVIPRAAIEAFHSQRTAAPNAVRPILHTARIHPDTLAAAPRPTRAPSSRRSTDRVADLAQVCTAR